MKKFIKYSLVVYLAFCIISLIIGRVQNADMTTMRYVLENWIWYVTGILTLVCLTYYDSD